MSQNIVMSPALSLSAAAKLIGPLSPSALLSAIRSHKYPSNGPKRSYVEAEAALKKHLLNNQPLTLAHGRDYVVRAFSNLAAQRQFRLPRGAIFSAPTPMVGISIGGVTLQSSPLVFLTMPDGTLGGLKVYWPQTELAKGAGQEVANVLYEQMRASHPNTNAQNCFVYSVSNAKLYRAKGPPSQKMSNACKVVAALWPTV